MVGGPTHRYRLRFAKQGLARFLSHRDLLRAFQRAGRRAGLPLAMTRGFNPHPLMAIPSALALGVEGHREALEIDLVDPADTDDLARAFDQALPAGLRVFEASTLPTGRRRPVVRTCWRIEELPWTQEQLSRRIEAFAMPGVSVRAGAGTLDIDLDGPKEPRFRDVTEALLGEPWPGQGTVIRQDVIFAQPTTENP